MTEKEGKLKSGDVRNSFPAGEPAGRLHIFIEWRSDP
jgi:hypothetical protein